VVNGLVKFESDLIFIHNDENVGQSLDFLHKTVKLVAMEDVGSQVFGETSFGLFHPLHGRKTGNDKSVVMRELLNETEHRARFAGLSQSDSQNTENILRKSFSNVFSELNLVGKHLVP
jgi:hypothetical protein